jgi:DNA-binding HxlR family transcriptional regulator
MKKKQQRRSDCPINFALETFGDRWSLLIIRDIVYFGKHSYGEFLDSDEKIASNILANRLAQLEADGILTKHPYPQDKRREIYRLTEKGLALVPILVEMVNWSFVHDPQTKAPAAWVTMVQARREQIIPLIQETVRRGGAIFTGENSVYLQAAAAGWLDGST